MIRSKGVLVMLSMSNKSACGFLSGSSDLLAPSPEQAQDQSTNNFFSAFKHQCNTT
jgi:anaerobic glycerol-3-phosphate dehydrogenase